MTQELLTIDQVAARLSLHVKTVRQFVRDGRLKGVKLGKQYRIARADLEAFTGQPAPSAEPVSRRRHVEVSTIVRAEGVSPEAADRITTHMLGALKGRASGAQPARLDTIHDAARATLKLVITADLPTTLGLIGLLNGLLET